MPDQSHFIGGGATDTILSPVVLVAMLIAIALILVLPRKYVIVPFLLFLFLTPSTQQIVAGGIHWMVGRIVVLAGLLRVMVSGPGGKSKLAGGMNGIDRAFILCMLCQAVGTVLQFMQSQALINQFGFLIDSLGAYFLVRVLIRDPEDIYRSLKCLALLCFILAACMVREQLTQQNIFGLLGGIQLTPDVREGKIRSQAVFQHSLMAGCFACALLPLFFLLWRNGKAKVLAAIGAVGCTIMTICAQSSTPLLGYAAGLLAVLLWPVRGKMRTVRWGLVIALCGLALVMKAPVWFVIAHIDLTGGSSGYHRAELIDQFIRHFRDWWLIGTNNAGSWGYDVWDTQNQYVNVGEAGGLLALGAFIAMISRALARIGNARRVVDGKGTREWLLWFLGAAFFSHLVSFFGVNYFDQSKVSWFALLAMISAATTSTFQMRARERQPKEPALIDVPRGEPLAAPSYDSLPGRDRSRIGAREWV